MSVWFSTLPFGFELDGRVNQQLPQVKNTIIRDLNAYLLTNNRWRSICKWIQPQIAKVPFCNLWNNFGGMDFATTSLHFADAVSREFHPSRTRDLRHSCWWSYRSRNGINNANTIHLQVFICIQAKKNETINFNNPNS